MIIWQAPLLNGAKSLSGNTGAVDFAAFEGLSVGDQIAISAGPLPGWNALTAKLTFGEVDPRYSDQRALLDAPAVAQVREGTETWARCKVMFPLDWVGSYPKWDQIGASNATTTARSNGGSILEWHHGPLDGNWNEITGSAPLYIGADDKNLIWELVDQKTSAPAAGFPNPLAALARGTWHDLIVHAVWSVDPTKGLLEFVVDGNFVVQQYRTATLYPNTYCYLMAGFYRNIHIGDPALKYSNGSAVYPKGDGEPQSVQITGLVVGTQLSDVLGAYPLTIPAPVPVLAPPPTAQSLIDQRSALQALLASNGIMATNAQQVVVLAQANLSARAGDAVSIQGQIDLITTKLDGGPWA